NWMPDGWVVLCRELGRDEALYGLPQAGGRTCSQPLGCPGLWCSRSAGQSVYRPSCKNPLTCHAELLFDTNRVSSFWPSVSTHSAMRTHPPRARSGFGGTSRTQSVMCCSGETTHAPPFTWGTGEARRTCGSSNKGGSTRLHA